MTVLVYEQREPPAAGEAEGGSGKRGEEGGVGSDG